MSQNDMPIMMLQIILSEGFFLDALAMTFADKTGIVIRQIELTRIADLI